MLFNVDNVFFALEDTADVTFKAESAAKLSGTFESGVTIPPETASDDPPLTSPSESYWSARVLPFELASAFEPLSAFSSISSAASPTMEDALSG